MKNLKKVLGVFVVFVMVAVLMLPTSVSAETDALDKVLTNGKLVVNSVEPKDISEAWSLVYEDKLMEVEGIWVDWDGSFNADYTKVTVYYGEYGDITKPKEVEIVYNYDKDIKAIVDAMVEKLPEDKTKFELTDLEYINYLLYNSENEEYYNLGDFSGQLKKTINYKNFNFVIDNRAGGGSFFSVEQMGIAKIQYDDTTYYIESMLGVTAKHIFYVDDNTTDVKKAIEDRISKAFGNVNIEVYDGEQTIEEFLDIEKASYQSDYRRYKEILDNYSSADEYADAMNPGSDQDRQYYMSVYYEAEFAMSCYGTEEEYVNGHMNCYEFLDEIKTAEVYILCMENGLNVPFAVVKDSSKVNENINYITNDAKTDITISSSSSTLPLDTIIKASKLTNGEEYDKIMKVLGVSNSETFDLTLYSNSTNENVTKLENCSFLVEIPVSKELEGKELIVYYVTSDEKIEEHEVTIKDGYATFETDHFSIYTLAEKNVDVNEGDTGNTPTETPSTTPSNSTTGSPQTGDNVELYVIILIISLAGLVSGVVYLRRK